MPDRIVVRGMSFLGRHGVLQDERERGQLFVVDVEIETDLSRAGSSDRLEDTIDYREVHARARQVLEGPPLALLEAVAEAVARRVLDLPGAERVVVRVHKPHAPIGGPAEDIAVEIARGRP